MGWTSEYVNFGRGNNAALKEKMASCFSGQSVDGKTKYEVIYQSVKGSQIYQAIEGIRENGERFVYANVILISWEGRELFYKDMEESMCPYYFNAPKKLIEMLTPTDSEHAIEWRKTVMQQYDKEKKPSVKVGDTIKFDEPIHFNSGHVADTFELCERENWKGGKIVKEKFFKEVSRGFSCKITNWRKKGFNVLSKSLSVE